MDHNGIADVVRKFIKENFLFDPSKPLLDDQSLLDSGVVDSTGILELLGFLEETYNVKFADHELVADNFDSVNRITNCIAGKLKA